MKLLFLTNVPSPYRVDFFNELGKHCDLTVLFEKKASDERDDSWSKYSFDNFKGIFLKGLSITTDTALSLEAVKYIKDRTYDQIICSGVSSLTSILAIEYMKLNNIQYYIEIDGGLPKSGKGFKEKLKKQLISNAKGYYSPSKLADEYLIFYGANKDNIHRYPFTSLYKKDILAKPLALKEKKQLRDKLNITEDKVVISVGRFSYLNGYGKGYDVLFKAFEQLPKDIGLYIVGDEPTQEFIEWKQEKNLTNIHFLPFKNKQELFEYYQASDISVLMSISEAWGLVINESMANALPVITTNKCVAGLELVEDDINGYILNVGDYETLINKINYIFSNKKLMKEMSVNSLNRINEYTIEKMAGCHYE